MNKLKNYLLDKGLEFVLNEHFNNGVFVDKQILVFSFGGAALRISKRDGSYQLTRIDRYGDATENKSFISLESLCTEIRDVMEEDRQAQDSPSEERKEEPKKRTKEDKQ